MKISRTALARHAAAVAVVLLTFAAQGPIERLVGPDWKRGRGLETRTQLVIDSSCVPVSAQPAIITRPICRAKKFQKRT